MYAARSYGDAEGGRRPYSTVGIEEEEEVMADERKALEEMVTAAERLMTRLERRDTAMEGRNEALALSLIRDHLGGPIARANALLRR
jgi:hypothetical protein